MLNKVLDKLNQQLAQEDSSYYDYQRLKHLTDESLMSDVHLARRSDGALVVTKTALVDQGRLAEKLRKLGRQADNAAIASLTSRNIQAIRDEVELWLELQTPGHLGLVRLNPVTRRAAQRAEHYFTTYKRKPDGPLYLVVEYLTGGTLRQLILRPTFLGRCNVLLLNLVGLAPDAANLFDFMGICNEQLERDTKLPVGQALDILACAADVLSYIHNKGYVHCDIKPQNFVFRRQIAPGQRVESGDLVLLDFGISRKEGQPSHPWRSRRWARPRSRSQSDQEGIQRSEDLYSLAKVLHFMLTAQYPPPSNADDAPLPTPQVEGGQLNFPPAVPLALRQEITERLNTLLSRCTLTSTATQPPADADWVAAEAQSLRRLLEPNLPKWTGRTLGQTTRGALLGVGMIVLTLLITFTIGRPFWLNITIHQTGLAVSARNGSAISTRTPTSTFTLAAGAVEPGPTLGTSSPVQVGEAPTVSLPTLTWTPLPIVTATPSTTPTAPHTPSATPSSTPSTTPSLTPTARVTDTPVPTLTPTTTSTQLVDRYQLNPAPPKVTLTEGHCDKDPLHLWEWRLNDRIVLAWRIDNRLPDNYAFEVVAMQRAGDWKNGSGIKDVREIRVSDDRRSFRLEVVPESITTVEQGLSSLWAIILVKTQPGYAKIQHTNIGDCWFKILK